MVRYEIRLWVEPILSASIETSSFPVEVIEQSLGMWSVSGRRSICCGTYLLVSLVGPLLYYLHCFISVSLFSAHGHIMWQTAHYQSKDSLTLPITIRQQGFIPFPFLVIISVRLQRWLVEYMTVVDTYSDSAISTSFPPSPLPFFVTLTWPELLRYTTAL